MLLQTSLAAALAAVSLASLAPTTNAPDPGPTAHLEGAADAKALYMEHCAKCHGATGDGKGTTELDRPARSFLLGGYSFGNTQKAVVRSITHGIPGTPMPAFAETLNAEQLAAVADHVIALGPPGTIVEPGASVLTVGDRPLIVQGMMPAYEEGGFREPRSLVIGFPNGTTFQYRTKDARLLTVRQGDFLDRRDWGGRGGAALKPLGTITWKASGVLKSESEFLEVGTGAALTRRVSKTEIRGDSVWIHFDLLRADGKKIGGGQEIISFLMVDDVPVAVRAVLGVSGTTEIALREIEGEPVTALVRDFEVEVRFHLAVNDPVILMVKKAADGIYVIDDPEVAGLRFYIHATQMSEALGTALNNSLKSKN